MLIPAGIATLVTTLRLRAPRLEQVVVHLVPPVTVFPVALGNDAPSENG
jgi:hypothetical protein